MVLLGISFNFGNVVVLPLLLGIGVDSGIHLVHRYRQAHDIDHESGSAEQLLLSTSTAQDSCDRISRFTRFFRINRQKEQT